MTENSTTPAEPDTPGGQGKHRGPAASQDAAPAEGPRGRHRRTEDRDEQESRAA
ncbi:hypothetical protein DSC45_14690 [Streptomyces sp. YIM 130001]|uniref:hypothetical protein n=1 Tax=Streptomyces sp. YIM 130001 TaxID=2259644 RepID=UPI000EC5A224|nr:hypothetical protein [Streptomyces sp. YIM 130001]RII17008.1 hypothetical protein DSC45_14690 [Streptomyces sp. YIM 130001]